jgi:hypothetical protein
MFGQSFESTGKDWPGMPSKLQDSPGGIPVEGAVDIFPVAAEFRLVAAQSLDEFVIDAIGRLGIECDARS